MLARIFATESGPHLTLLRLALAIVLFPHGAQKALAWFGGPGFSATVAGMGQGFGIPGPLAVVAILTEFVAPLVLLVGLGTRIAAVGVAVLMGVAASFHLPNGFFMNWLGTQGGEGYEFHVLAIAIALALVIGGGGALSLDREIAARASEPRGMPTIRLRRAA